jgi:hypothetical protein
MIIRAIWYFNRTEPLRTEMKEGVKALWGRLINRCATREIDSDKQRILAGLFDWVSLFDEIDDEMYGWLALFAAYIRYGRAVCIF